MADSQAEGRRTKAQEQPEGKQITMSILTPEEALNKARVTGQVEGKVARIIERGSDGKRFGFELAETIRTSTGQSWERNWTVWQADTTIELDAHIIVTGDVSFKYEEYARSDGNGMGAKVIGHINNPHIKPAFTQKPTEEMPF